MTTQTLNQRPRILAVDDDKDVLKLLETALGRAGYDVATALDGPSALKYIDAEHPDLMLLDLWMPVMDGFGVLEQLNRRDRTPRVVCLTGKTDTDGRQRAWRLGVDEYVTKPFRLERVIEVVKGVSVRPGVIRESQRRTALDTLSWT